MICNFMIFLEYVGSRACLSARNNMKEADSKGQLFFYLSSCTVALRDSL